MGKRLRISLRKRLGSYQSSRGTVRSSFLRTSNGRQTRPVLLATHGRQRMISFISCDSSGDTGSNEVVISIGSSSSVSSEELLEQKAIWAFMVLGCIMIVVLALWVLRCYMTVYGSNSPVAPVSNPAAV